MRNTSVAVVFVLAVGCRSTRPQHASDAPTSLAAPASAAASTSPTASPRASLKPSPSTPEECRACGGLWGRHGLAQKEGCLCRTKDAGKVCRSKTDCESQCVAKDEPDTEVVDSGPPAKGYFLGKCHPYTSYFGCGILLRQAVNPEALDVAPPRICVD